MPNSFSKTQLAAHFDAHFQAAPTHFVRAPGRINLIGEHLDYNSGFVLPAAIDRAMYFAARPNGTAETRVFSIDFDKKATFLNENAALKLDHDWPDFFAAMLLETQKRSLPTAGLDLIFGSDIPTGAGLSSSAALCSGVLFLWNEWFGWQLSRLDLAKIGQATEHRMGINCGIMDQFASLHGRADWVLELDCLDLKHRYFPLQLADYQLLLINTNVKHRLTDSAYNDRRADCEAAIFELKRATAGRVQTFRDVNFELLAAVADRLSENEKRRARFVVEEIERVKTTTAALLDRDLKTVGKNLFAAHRGLRDDYEVSCAELDLLIELAEKEPIVLGARMMGGGFGGCTLNLIRTDETPTFLKKILPVFEEKVGWAADPILVKLAEGVSWLD